MRGTGQMGPRVPEPQAKSQGRSLRVAEPEGCLDSVGFRGRWMMVRASDVRSRDEQLFRPVAAIVWLARGS